MGIKLSFSRCKYYLAPVLKWYAKHLTCRNTWALYYPRKKKIKEFKEQKSTKIKGTKSACSEDRATTESKCAGWVWTHRTIGKDTQGNGKGYSGFSFVLTILQVGQMLRSIFSSACHAVNLSHQSPNRVSGKIFLLSVLCLFFSDPVMQLWFSYPLHHQCFLL